MFQLATGSQGLGAQSLASLLSDGADPRASSPGWPSPGPYTLSVHGAMLRKDHVVARKKHRQQM